MRRNDRATVWISVADIRISDRRRRSMSDVKVEQYRQLLEHGFQRASSSRSTQR